MLQIDFEDSREKFIIKPRKFDFGMALELRADFNVLMVYFLNLGIKSNIFIIIQTYKKTFVYMCVHTHIHTTATTSTIHILAILEKLEANQKK